MSAHSAGYQAGQFIGYFIPLAIGVAVSLYLRKKRGGEKVPGWPIIVGLVVSLLACVGNQPGAGQAQTTAAADPSDELEVKQNVIGPASKFDPNFLPDQLREYEKRMQQETAANLQRNGFEIDVADVIVTSTPEMVGSNRIVKTFVQMRPPSQLFLYQFAGISGSQFVVVVCRMTSDKPFEMKGSACEKRVDEVFGKAA